MQVLFLFIFALVLLDSTFAFHGVPTPSFQRSNKANDVKSTSAVAWSLLIPDVPVLPMNNWYNEVSNPTARSITYDDGPFEFRFAAIGSNWPEVTVLSSASAEEEAQGKTTSRRNGPLHRAGKWIRSRL